MGRVRKLASVEVIASLDDPLEFGSESRFAFFGSHPRENSPTLNILSCDEPNL